MAEYIERDEAINAVFGAMADGRAVFPALLNLPAADVRPTVKARWTDHRTNEHDGEWYCSACGEEPWLCGVTEDILPKYCPNCGAMMEE